jgi:predicted transcriptional regulator
VICDGAGAILYRRPLPGFVLPRHGAGCPLWPLYQSLTRPSAPLMAVLAMPGTAPRRVLAQAVAVPVGPVAFGAAPVLQATMLLTPADGMESPALPVGTACRVCPRQDCAARREPSILGAGA